MSSYAIRGDSRVVEAWSPARLPFEPRGWLLDFRHALNTAVRGLSLSGQAVLRGEYVSADHRPCDVENVLFYNVGLGAFAAVMLNGVVFERRYTTPPNGPLVDASHYHRYEVADPSAGWRSWRRGQVHRSWTPRAIPSQRDKAAAWWWAFGHGADQTDTRSSGKPFGVELVVDIPRRGGVLPIHHLIKPAIDGLIASCHQHHGSDLPVVAEQLAGALGADRSEVAARLMAGTGAVLGRRRLLWRRGTGVQWNPGDDDCVAARVVVRHGVAPGQLAISGHIFDVDPNGRP